MKKTIQLASIETGSLEILAVWIQTVTVDRNPAYVSSLGEDRAEVSGSCGFKDPAKQDPAVLAYQPPKFGQDPACSLDRIPLSNNPDPGSFGQWIRLAA